MPSQCQSLRDTTFDDFAEDYESALQRGLSLSGEGADYFARGRIAWLAGRLAQLGQRPRSVLDFGCGVGASTPLFAELLGVEEIVGVDTSAASLDRARRLNAGRPARFLLPSNLAGGADIDLAYSNGTFHHIEPSQRREAIGCVGRTLRPGGLFALWENNPWNPGTRWVMRRIPFDRDAIPLSAREAVRLLSSCGFDVLRVDHLFLFPRFCRWLRPLERWACGLPLGAQYQVLGRKRQDAVAGSAPHTPMSRSAAA
jgi:SAM-dependent methyltransferase